MKALHAPRAGWPLGRGPVAALSRTAAALIGLSALWLVAGPAQAADEVARIQLEQRISLVATLLSDSTAARRIASSGNEQAVSHLDEGRVHHAAAQALLNSGDFAGARREADDALRHLGMARRLVPDAPARQTAARQRHEQLLDSVERLIESWRARAATQPPGDGSDLTAAVGLVGMARRQAQDGRYDDANQALVQAERHVLAGTARTLATNTLDYTQRAASPAEEFQNELARHRGYAELLPLAVRDLKPRPDAQALIERYAETSTMLQTQAVQQFQAGDAAQALTQIRSATLYVQRALLAAGLVTPQAAEAPP